MISFNPQTHHVRLNMPMPSSIQLDFHYSDGIVYKDAPSTWGHIHPYCEMYIYLSGNVAFAVNNMLYKLEPGDIIFTSPNHFHHCVCLEESQHRHCCFFFREPDPMFLPAFDMLADRVHLHYPEEMRDKIIHTCLTLFDLSSQNDQNDRTDGSEHFHIISEFYRLLSLLCSDNSKQVAMKLPVRLKQMLLYIGECYSSIKNVDDLARHFNQTTMIFKKL